jgi:hypothetical protein
MMPDWSWAFSLSPMVFVRVNTIFACIMYISGQQDLNTMKTMFLNGQCGK